MKKKIKNGLYLILILISVFLVFEIANYWILISPRGYFEYELKYNKFKVYSDEPLTFEINGALDEVSKRLSVILDYNSDQYFEIFICNNSLLYKKFANKIGKPEQTQGFNLQPLNYTFVNLSFISKMKNREGNKFRYNILEGNLSHIIAHEITHQLITDKVGYLKARSTETWKLEGYCEYAASVQLKKEDKSYQFYNEVSKFNNGYYSGISDGRMYYIKSLLMVEYYLDYKGNSFDELMNNDIPETNLFEELQQAFKNKTL